MKACARTEGGIMPMVPLANKYGINSETRRDRFMKINEYI